MKKNTLPAEEDLSSIKKRAYNRRAFLRNTVVAGSAVTVGTGILETIPLAEADSGRRGIT